MYTVGHVTALFVSDVIWFFSLVWLWEIIHCFVWGCLNIVSLLTRQVDVCAIPFPHFHYFFSTSLPHYCLNLSCGRIFFRANLHRQQSSNRVGHSGGLQAGGTRTLILWLLIVSVITREVLSINTSESKASIRFYQMFCELFKWKTNDIIEG